MASNRIKGITIEIEGNTTKLSESLRQVDKNLKDTQSQLRDVNKLLKLDPKNTELLRQKQTLLKSAISDTKDKLDQERDALKQLEAVKDPTPEMVKQQDALRREIVDTEASLERYNDQLSDMPSKLDAVANASAQVAQKTKAISALAAGGGFALLNNAKSAALAADDLATLANQTGFSVEELQKMQYASDFIDVSMDDMTGSIQKMTKQMASGNDAFATLGVSITDADGNMRNATDVWYEALDALSQVSNETERDQLSMELFGKSAMDMAGIVDDGGAALKQLGDEAEETGLILSGDAVQSAVAFNDQMDKLKNTASQAFFSAGAALAESLAPALEDLVDKVVAVISWFGNLDGSTQAIIVAILAAVAAISPLATLISSIITLLPVLSGLFAALTGPIGIAVVVIGSLIAAGVALWQNWDTVKAKASELWSSISSTFENIKTTISNKINDAKNAVTNAVERIKGAFNFSWSLPQIKLPHFRVSGGEAPWGFGGLGRMPSISVSWYKKAYKNALLFSEPTVMATPYGYKGFGDGNGSELVIGTDRLREIIGAGANNININVYANPGMNETALANAIAVKLDRWLGERV